MKLNKPFCLWLTGLPSAGKTTTARALKQALLDAGINAIHLDGDVVRKGLNEDLKFSAQDRAENLRRITHVSEIIVSAGVPVITSFISPYKQARDKAREIIPNFIEVYVSTPLSVCKERDVKGLYEKAAKGEIQNMTGTGEDKDSRYEAPENPEILLQTEEIDIEDNVRKIISYLEAADFIF
jgi:adenylyl-sulfate kinase